jgi:hypothetical protein
VGGQAITLKITPPESSLLNPAFYAPALPGVAVAVLGLWLGHVLARSKDRRKEIADLCDKLKLAAAQPSDAAMEAWLDDTASPERPLKVDTSRNLPVLRLV